MKLINSNLLFLKFKQNFRFRINSNSNINNTLNRNLNTLSLSNLGNLNTLSLSNLGNLNTRVTSVSLSSLGKLRYKRFYTYESEINIEKEIEEKIKKTIESEKILVFIKGTPNDPQCKYSYNMIEILNNYKLNYSYINVFSHDLLRKCIKNISNWPTFPQLYVNGKFIGGSDIVHELHINGQLYSLLHNQSNSQSN